MLKFFKIIIPHFSLLSNSYIKLFNQLCSIIKILHRYSLQLQQYKLINKLNILLAKPIPSLISSATLLGNPLRWFPTKNIPLECFSTLLHSEKYKLFRSLRRATKGSAFEKTRAKLLIVLKKVKQKCSGQKYKLLNHCIILQ